MREIVLKGLTFVPYIDTKTIGQAIKKLGERLKADFKDRDPLFVCIMNGSFMFASELMYAIDEDFEVAFARYSSYQGTKSTFELKEVMPVTQSLEGVSSSSSRTSSTRASLCTIYRSTSIAWALRKSTSLRCSPSPRP